MRRLLKGFLACSVIAFSAFVFGDVVIVVPDTDHAKNIAVKLKENIPKYITVKISTSVDNIDSEDLVVPLGNNQYLKLLSSDYNLLPTFISFYDFASRKKKEKVKSVLYSDPSPKAIASFLSEHFKTAKIGYIYSSEDEGYMRLIQEHLDNKNKLVSSKYEGNTFTSIKNLIKKDIDLIFIGRNREVYTRDNIRFVLDSLFRKNIPVLTSSPVYVKAGASVSISPSEDAIITMTALAIERHYKQKDLIFKDIFIDECKIGTNSSMTDFYNLNIEKGPK